jgi:hypothetical protein
MERGRGIVRDNKLGDFDFGGKARRKEAIEKT